MTPFRQLLLLLLSLFASAQEDCALDPTLEQLNSRPWFCEPPGPRNDGRDDLARCLGGGHTLNRTVPGLCRGRWQWYQVRTLHSHNVPYYEIASNEDGSTKHVRETRQVAGMRHALAVHVQTEFCPHSPECGQPQQPQFHYSTVDVLVVDGEPTHRWSTPSPFGNTRTEAALDQFYSGDRWGRAVRFYKERKSVTFSLGFHMNRTQDCEPQLCNTVNIGIYCSWRPPNNYDLDQKQCRFTVTANLIPEYVYDGFDATYPIAPAGDLGRDDFAPAYMRDEYGIQDQEDAASHYFKLILGGYDVLNISVARIGHNLTWYDSTGQLGTNGHGFRGIAVRRRAEEGCPLRMFQDQAVNVTPMTVAIELPSFCTDLVDAGTYIVGVLSEAAFGPFDPSLPFSTYGKVGPDLQPLGFSNNRLEQVGYGQYRLRIHHVSYYAGTISNGEVRGGCLAYGQWRTYHIDTVGENASVLEISLTSPISAIYARAGREVVQATATSYAQYDVRSPEGATVATASPCDVTGHTRWHVALLLENKETAVAKYDLQPSEFEMEVRLRPARLKRGTFVPPRGLGGRGFACCGATRYFRLSDVAEHETVTAFVNVTSGRLRAVLAKWGSCPHWDADVDRLRGECRDFCEMAWMTTRGGYSGQYYSIGHALLVVPHGNGDKPDRRRDGAWYLGVQAMPDEAAEFSIIANIDVPSYVPVAQRCDKITFACSRDSARQSWQQMGPPAPPPSLAALAFARASGRRQWGALSREYISSIISNDIVQRMSFFVGVLVSIFSLCWCLRTYRYRRRRRYHLPHETWA